MMFGLTLKYTAPFIRGFLFCSLFVSCAQSNSYDAGLITTEETITSTIDVQPENEELRKYFHALAGNGKFNGVALLSSQDQITKLREGERVIGDSDTLSLNDVFQLASLSKPLSALGVLTLVQKGKLNLDDEVIHYLKDFPYDQITVRSLLNHTSGMGNYIYVTDSLWNKPDSFMTNGDLYDLIICDQVPRYYQPLKRFDYCNTNYALVPLLIEAVAGVSFEDYMRLNVFEPLGMHSTYYFDTAKVYDYKVRGHYPNGDFKQPFYLDAIVGDKSLYSSVFDLYKLFEELKKPTLISTELSKESMSIQAKTGYDSFYGLGWRIKPIDCGDTLIYHNGWWRGFRSYFWMSKHEDKVAIILTNSIRGGYLNREEIWNLF